MVKSSPKKPQPKVAIITRTKNRNLLLRRALDSVRAQDYTDFVHVIVNDGGDKDGVNNIVKNYGHNIIVVHNEVSLGLTPALNQGIKAVNTKYVCILDDDDSWSSDRLAKTVSYLEKSGAKGVICAMDRIVEEIQGTTIKEISRNRIYENLVSVSLYKQCLDNYLSNGCFMYLREVYDELKGYNEDLLVAEDWDFGIRFLLKYDVDVILTKEALVMYHHRPQTKGDEGNFVFYRIDEHKRHLTLLANYYLRKDIKEGKLGVGYIMNSLMYRRNDIIPYEESRTDAQTVRLEGHVNRQSQNVEASLQEEIRKMKENTFTNKVGRKLKVRARRVKQPKNTNS